MQKLRVLACVFLFGFLPEASWTLPANFLSPCVTGFAKHFFGGSTLGKRLQLATRGRHVVAVVVNAHLSYSVVSGNFEKWNWSR